MRAAVIYGGTSPEREVSLATGASVLEHFPTSVCEAVPIEILGNGDWRRGKEPPVPPRAAAALLDGIDVCFLALHGRFGEDGTIQGFLETLGLPYTGSGVAASAIAMDKARAREIVSARGISVPRAMESRRAVRVPPFGFPAVVKDPTGGSSLDLAIVRDEREFRSATERLLRRPGARVLVEEYLAGEEITCAVLGNASVGGGLTAFPPVLIRPLRSEWFDYATKYDPGAVDEICPAPVPPAVTDRVTALALLVHEAIGCDGITRSDFIVPKAGGEPRFLEINTLPGLTSASLSPKAAAAAGLTFPDLLEKLLGLALERADQPKKAP